VTTDPLLNLAAIAGLVTVYTTVDMLRYNRKRKAEFLEAQKQMRSDSLEAARLAYMRGDATDEQIALVEEANTRAAAGGDGAAAFKMPSILGTPSPVTGAPVGASEGKLQTGATWPGAMVEETAAKPGESPAAPQQEKKVSGGLKAWLFSSLSKEEEGEEVGTSERRLGWESLSEEDDGAGVRDSDLIRAVEEKQAYIKEKAREAFEKEKENQRKGGLLDRVGIEGARDSPDRATNNDAPKKSWWHW